MMKKRRQTRKEVKISSHCLFCEKRTDPNYLQYEELEKFMSERGRMLGRSRSGLCSKHQKKFAIAVKRARHLGLI